MSWVIACFRFGNHLFLNLCFWLSHILLSASKISYPNCRRTLSICPHFLPYNRAAAPPQGTGFILFCCSAPSAAAWPHSSSSRYIHGSSPSAIVFMLLGKGNPIWSSSPIWKPAFSMIYDMSIICGTRSLFPFFRLFAIPIKPKESMVLLLEGAAS